MTIQFRERNLKFNFDIINFPVVNESDLYYLDHVPELYLNKVDKLHTKMEKHVKHVFEQMKYEFLINSLDGFTGNHLLCLFYLFYFILIHITASAFEGILLFL